MTCAQARTRSMEAARVVLFTFPALLAFRERERERERERVAADDRSGRSILALTCTGVAPWTRALPWRLRARRSVVLTVRDGLMISQSMHAHKLISVEASKCIKSKQDICMVHAYLD